MDSDWSEEAQSSTEKNAATSRKAPQMIDTLVDAVNYGKHPDVNRARFKTSFKKAFITAMEKKVLVRRKAAEAAQGVRGRVKLATEAKPKERAAAAVAQPASDRSANPGPSTKAAPKKTESSEAVATEGRAKGAEARKPPGLQKKPAAGENAKPAVADIESKSSTIGRKAASSGTATEAGKSSGTAVMVEKGNAVDVKVKAGKGKGVSAKRVKDNISDDETKFLDLEIFSENGRIVVQQNPFMPIHSHIE
ncbi:uncharacterized protein LOC144107479 [Amblyomma americanum]